MSGSELTPINRNLFGRDSITFSRFYHGIRDPNKWNTICCNVKYILPQ